MLQTTAGANPITTYAIINQMKYARCMRTIAPARIIEAHSSFATRAALCHPFVVRWIFASAVLLVACSSQSGAPPAYCASDPRVEAFDVPLLAKGAAGASVVIESGTPAVVQQGLNEWIVKITDASGNPADGTVTVVSSMPDHGHNSPTPATITDNGNGEYDIAGINLSMRGVWTITISIASASLDDSATFTFCVDGS